MQGLATRGGPRLRLRFLLLVPRGRFCRPTRSTLSGEGKHAAAFGADLQGLVALFALESYLVARIGTVGITASIVVVVPLAPDERLGRCFGGDHKSIVRYDHRVANLDSKNHGESHCHVCLTWCQSDRSDTGSIDSSHCQLSLSSFARDDEDDDECFDCSRLE